MKKQLVFIAVLIGIIYFLGWHLQPFEAKFFSFHDDTQVGRMKEFAFSLKNLQIPPRLAPHFSFGMGFPVFNFYAPFSYWVGGLLHVVGIPIVAAAKTSFFLAVLALFVFSFLYISSLFSFEAGLVAATVYTSSIWIATEIFARGNIGELWFIAFLPLSLYFLEKNAKSTSPFIFVLTVVVISCALTSHNVLSIIGFLLFVMYSFTTGGCKKNLLTIVVSLLLSAYFFLPLGMESSFTYAKIQAENTPYKDHFLCLSQLWSSPTWELGGSGTGCNDGMSFKLGKIQLTLGVLGFLTWIISSLFRKNHSLEKNAKYSVIGFFGLMSLFMMFKTSTFLWKMFSFILTAFQFPWRFNSFFLFFIAFFAGYFVHSLKKHRTIGIIVQPITLLLVIMMLSSSRPYFRHPWRLSYNEYYSKYVSDEYIYRKIAHAIPEYLPRVSQYQRWMNYGTTQKKSIHSKEYAPFFGNSNTIKVTKNLPYEKQMVSLTNQNVTVNTLYFPFWHITVNDKIVIPKSFDSLGRPILSVTKSSIIKVKYKETFVETIGNYITILTIGGLGVVAFNKKLWNKLNNTNT